MEQLLYIDPGTGSMLISILFGIMTTVFFVGRAALIKIKFLISGGKKAEADRNRQPFVIFTDSKRYWNVFEPICDEFERRKMPLAYYTQSEDDPALSKEYEFVRCEFIGRGNKGIARMNFLNADICLATTPGLDVLQWKRSKLCKCYVHIPHSLDDMLNYRMFALDFYDAVLLTGDFQGGYIRRLEEMRSIPAKELVTVGYPPMEEQKRRLDAMPPRKKSDVPTVLVAPSWGKSAILSKFGAEFLESVTATGYNIVVRPHPQTMTSEKEMIEPLMDRFKENDRFHWNFDNDNFRCMADADLMITDFSGIIFDFALLFDKPLIYADVEFDDSPYDAWYFHGEKMWRFEVLDEIGKKLCREDFGDMKKIIDDAIGSNTMSEGRKKARDEAWMHRGESAVRIVDYLSRKSAEIEAVRRQDEGTM